MHTPTYTSPYAAIRAGLDYDYHRPVSPSRLRVQDEYVTRALSRPFSRGSSPVLVLTAGAMGAGKSHYLSRLPFEYVLIDPDDIAARLPGYSAKDEAWFESKDAMLQPLSPGDKPVRASLPPPTDPRTRLRHEARLVTEVLLHAALARSADIVLDGSLRSYPWYLSTLPRLREQHPQYRLELVHIHCPLAEVLRRAEKRATKTGRHVPPQLIERSWRDARRAISVLGRKKIVDRVQMVDSSGPTPKIVYDSRNDDDWVKRGVPGHISRVDKLPVDIADVVENGDDLKKARL
ncbi:hypothetical protein PYCC9005_001364 [Savitreella phatthalungensis]